MLLPTDSIDVVINLASPIRYIFDGQIINAGAYHFNGRREKAVTIMQSGDLRLFGVSFQPYGLYPFIKTPVNQLPHHIVNVESVSPSLAADIDRAVGTSKSIGQAICILEATLIRHLDVSSRDADAANVLRSFQNWDSSISMFCNQTCLDIKQLERLCQKYIGLNPGKLKRVEKIQAASRQIIQLQSKDSLTTLAYDNDYFDQSHLIREFRTFLGLTPNKFRRDHMTVRDITKYSYQ